MARYHYILTVQHPRAGGIDYEASDGVETVYRSIGYGKEFPHRTVTDAEL